MSRICEEFHTDILGALRQPVPTALRIIELRDYARARAALERYDAADKKTRGPAPTGPMIDRVRATQSQARRWLIDQKRQARRG